MALFARSLEPGLIEFNGSVVTAGGYDSSFGIRTGVRESSGVASGYVGTGQGIGGPFSGEFWHRMFFKGQDSNTYTSGRTLFEYLNSTGTAVFRCYIPSTGILQFQYWDGAAWVNIGAALTVNRTALYKTDLHIVAGTSFEFFWTTDMGAEPTSATSGSATMTSVTGIDEIRAYNTRDTGNSVNHSEWIWGDEPTIGHRYVWRPPSGDGTDVAGTGTYIDVDEPGITDTDTSTLAAAGDAETYVHGAMTAPTGVVKAVQVEARVRVVTGGAANVKGRLRVGGVAYDQASNFAGIGANYAAYVARWTDNPAGGSWTREAATATTNEFGLIGQA